MRERVVYLQLILRRFDDSTLSVMYLSAISDTRGDRTCSGKPYCIWSNFFSFTLKMGCFNMWKSILWSILRTQWSTSRKKQQLTQKWISHIAWHFMNRTHWFYHRLLVITNPDPIHKYMSGMDWVNLANSISKHLTLCLTNLSPGK